MGIEKRVHDRYPAFGVVRIASIDKDGNRGIFSVMLRDRSKYGLGGVYVGQEELQMDNGYELEEDGKIRPMRLVWKKAVANFVCVVGFLIADEEVA